MSKDNFEQNPHVSEQHESVTTDDLSDMPRSLRRDIGTRPASVSEMISMGLSWEDDIRSFMPRSARPRVRR